ncbi:hypothetical protein ACFV06_22605 [Streptomyces sp. NPDC059618]|uniref:hypothetical protein n=1 Tax=Streptomyces sp. NPDC059618 TaxID=3346887 RepID=UPI0036A00A78
MIRPLGFFSELDPGWGLPLGGLMRDFVRPVGDSDEAEVIGYLRQGVRIWAEMSAGPDVLDPDADAPVLSGIGSLCTDGVWLWRQDLPYYLSKYHLSLPAEFLARVRKVRYEVPEVPEAKVREILTRDLGVAMD